MEEKDLPLISIIIPCYNTEKFMKNCFESLDNQTYKNLHIIFIDDGSKDNTLKLIQDYCNTHKNCCYHTGENGGVSNAKNIGLGMVKGEYFTLCDADDLLEPIHIENLYKILIRADADMSVAGFERVKSTKKKIVKNIAYKDKKLQIFDREQALQQYFSQKKFDYLLVNKLYKTSILKESNAHFIKDTRYGEESYFAYLYLKHCNKVAYANVKTYYYVQWKTSLIHVGFNESRLALVSNLDILLNQCSQEMPEIVPYIHSIRANYICGLLYFIQKSDYRDIQKINELIGALKEDSKYLKFCKRSALYRRLFIPIVPYIFSKTIKPKKETK